MVRNSVGISDISIYIPQPEIELNSLIKERARTNPRLERYLVRAQRMTGQQSIRFPDPWEDTATMAAQAAHRLIQANPSIDLESLRYLTVGTETSVDQSKPVSAYVEGLLQAAGQDVPESLSTFQIQHACAGGTLSLLSVGALLSMSSRPRDSGMVICSDIARYDRETTAEITQGAGSVALLVENNPRLIEIDLSTQGYCSKDVDDFFRPLGSRTARVKGRYSMDCYIESLEEAFLDHCRRRGEHPAQVLASTDLFVLHTPFLRMPEIAMQKLLQHHLSLVNGQTESFLEDRGFYAGIDPVARIGNLYTGSMYVVLAALLADRFRVLGEKIVGKRLLFASYGSGNTMVVFSGRVAQEAPEVIREWALEDALYYGRDTGFEEYNTWINGPYQNKEYRRIVTSSIIPPGSFYLEGIREDGYHEYTYKARLRDWSPESQASNDLYRSVEV